MTEAMRGWFRENASLAIFLIAQAIAVMAAVLSMTAYMTKLESRVTTLEVRGSPHLSEINNRLTVTEKETEGQGHRIDRVVEIMLRELPVKKEQLR